MKPIYVLNGPNLNRLGKREPAIYGTTTLAEVEQLCRAASGDRPIVFHQSNSEEKLIDLVHEAIDEGAGIVINPAAFSYAGYPVLDAIKMCTCPIVEVHISNIYRRDEAWRAKSLLSPAVTGLITGLGAHGYALAVRHIARLAR